MTKDEEFPKIRSALQTSSKALARQGTLAHVAAGVLDIRQAREFRRMWGALWSCIDAPVTAATGMDAIE